MTQDIRLIAIDLDGTLLDSDKRIPPRNIEAIRRAAREGVKIVLCSGRPVMGIKPYFQELGLGGEEFVIGNNGCTTYQTEGWQLFDYHDLTKDQLQMLYDNWQQSPQPSLVFMTPTTMYVIGDEVSDIVARDAETAFHQAKAVSFEELIRQTEPVLLGLFMDHSQPLDGFQEKAEPLLSQHFHTVRGLDYVFEAMPFGVNKASSLNRLADRMGIHASQVMALGDASNDIEMLTYAGLGVAMGNADGQTKELANAITANNDQAGVALAIEKYVLKNGSGKELDKSKKSSFSHPRTVD